MEILTVNTHTRKQQSGVVLVISLIMLLLLTIIGVTSMQVNTLEEKMTGNSRDQNIAFQAAESTLKEAEIFILNNPIDSTFYTGSNGLLDIADNEPANFFTHGWSGSDSATTTANYGNNFGLIADPRYIIKKVSQTPANGSDPLRTYFRITARAQGASANTQVILQEYFMREN